MVKVPLEYVMVKKRSRFIDFRMCLLYANSMISSIIIDATHFSTKDTTGVENYVSSLLPLLSALLLEKGFSVAWIGHQEHPHFVPKDVEWIYSPYQPFWSQRGLLRELNTRKPGLFFTPSGIAPLFYSGKTAVTVHDMSVYLSPDAFSFAQKVRLKYLLKVSARKAVVILTPSQYSASNIEKIWKISPKKIQVTHLALPKISDEQEPIQEIPSGPSMITFIGRIERKKNLLPVIRAFSQINDPNTVLVLAGKEGFGIEEIRSLIKQKRIFLTGYISDQQKRWLLANSSVIVAPCLIEGFGIPVLEAFFAGCPVICSRSGSLPEVAAEAVVYVSGKNEDEWAEQLENLLNQPELRAKYVKLGKKRLADFNWAETAERTAQSFFALK